MRKSVRGKKKFQELIKIFMYIYINGILQTKRGSHLFLGSTATILSSISVQRVKQSSGSSDDSLACILESCLKCTFLEPLMEQLPCVNQVQQNLMGKIKANDHVAFSADFLVAIWHMISLQSSVIFKGLPR